MADDRAEGGEQARGRARPPSAKAMAVSSVSSRAVRRPRGSTSAGKRSVKMRRVQVGASQNQRRVCRRTTTGNPCQGKSPSRR